MLSYWKYNRVYDNLSKTFVTKAYVIICSTLSLFKKKEIRFPLRAIDFGLLIHLDLNHLKRMSYF